MKIKMKQQVRKGIKKLIFANMSNFNFTFPKPSSSKNKTDNLSNMSFCLDDY